MNAIQLYEYGKKRTATAATIINNTYIGGVKSIIANKTQLAAKLGILEADISYFGFVGDDIEANITVSYELPINCFSIVLNPANAAINKFYDLEGKVTKLNTQCFYGNRLGSVYFPNVTEMGDNVFRGTNIRDFIFTNLYQLLNNGAGSRQFRETFFSRNFLMPNLEIVGSSTGYDDIFFSTNVNAEFLLDSFLQTSNAGAEEGDIAYVRGRGNEIRYTDNTTGPNPVTNLNITGTFATSITLSFDAPIITANPIWFYEVFINGIFNTRVFGTKFSLKRLKPSSLYTIQVFAYDKKGKKSTAAEITSSTVATELFPAGRIEGYYKFENSVIDQTGVNMGDGLNISYQAGLGGTEAVYNGINAELNLGMADTLDLRKGALVCLFNTSNAGTGYRALITKRNAYGIYFVDNILATYDWGAGGALLSTGINIADGLDHVAILNFDLSGAINGTEVYLDGSLALTTTTKYLDFNSVVKIGNADSRTHWLNAKIGAAAFVNGKLTATEISNITNKLLLGENLI